MRSARPVVLCYHAVSETWDDTLSVRPAEFERQLRWLLRRGFRPATAADVVGGRGRLVHVTFDDAFRSVANALPVLERLGIPATVFACSGFADEGRPLDIPELASEAAGHPDELATMDWDALAELAARGVEIGSHTVSHPHLPRLGDAELGRELTESRERLEERLARPCRFLAYPFGEEDARVHAAARAAGYEAAFALPGPADHANPFAVPRVGVWRRDGTVRFALKSHAAGGAAAAARRALTRLRPEPRSRRRSAARSG